MNKKDVIQHLQQIISKESFQNLRSIMSEKDIVANFSQFYIMEITDESFTHHLASVKSELDLKNSADIVFEESLEKSPFVSIANIKSHWYILKQCGAKHEKFENDLNRFLEIAQGEDVQWCADIEALIKGLILSMITCELEKTLSYEQVTSLLYTESSYFIENGIVNLACELFPIHSEMIFEFFKNENEKWLDSL